MVKTLIMYLAFLIICFVYIRFLKSYFGRK